MIIYDINELTKILKVSRATIIRYIKSKELKAFKVGNSWRITKDVNVNTKVSHYIGAKVSHLLII